MEMGHIMSRAPVIPVISIDDPAKAVPLARALVAGGLPVLEITFRTDAAFEAVERVVAEVPEALVGVGTVRRATDLERARELGARFVVTPGLTAELIDAAGDISLPLLPGVMTPSEVMRALDAGYSDLKLFPAAAAGGLTMLKALAGPFPDVRFCPTGGVGPRNLVDYLSLGNVTCVGGSWVTPAAAVAEGDWTSVSELARAACDQAKSVRQGTTDTSAARTVNTD